jgi:hypothetical protein
VRRLARSIRASVAPATLPSRSLFFHRRSGTARPHTAQHALPLPPQSVVGSAFRPRAARSLTSECVTVWRGAAWRMAARRAHQVTWRSGWIKTDIKFTGISKPWDLFARRAHQVHVAQARAALRTAGPVRLSRRAAPAAACSTPCAGTHLTLAFLAQLHVNSTSGGRHFKH